MLDFGFYNMDCMKGMKEFPDEYFDLAIVDPPYGIGVQSMQYTKTGKRHSSRKSAAACRDYRRTDEWDIKPSAEYFEERGFDYVGFEIDADYYQKAQKRLEENRAQISMDFLRKLP